MLAANDVFADRATARPRQVASAAAAWPVSA
jgi:hypothetical protein